MRVSGKDLKKNSHKNEKAGQFCCSDYCLKVIQNACYCLRQIQDDMEECEIKAWTETDLEKNPDFD